MPTVRDYFLETSADNTQNNAYIVTKFGHNSAVGTSPVPVSHGAIYRTPQVGSATKIRVKAGNANDTANGTGAREIAFEGIKDNGEFSREFLATAGESASSNSVEDYIRVFRAWVSKSGTYGSQTTGSHTADIVLENAAGTQDWLTIDLDPLGFADGQSEVGAYTVPKGKNAYLLSLEATVDTTKTTSLFFYKRESILDTAAPYQAVRKQFGLQGLVGNVDIKFSAPLKFEELTDIGFLASVDAGTASVSVKFTLLIRDAE